jgi:hypothetical protein
MLGSVCGVPSHRVSRYAGTDVTLVSDAEKRVANCAVSRSVKAVPNSPLLPPCLFKIVQLCRELGGPGKKLR